MKNHLILLLLILIISGFLHLWNPMGFPDIFFDEGVYVERGYNLSDKGILQENPFFYDHPYLGQILLGSVTFFSDTDEIESPYLISDLHNLYLLPRIFVGFVAVLDTFLIYMIVSKIRDPKTALVASSLFAVMPFTWILRGVLLDSLVLPFVLASIFVALYSQDSKRLSLVLLSGILLGLAIFTKIPAFTIIPMLTYLVYQRQRQWNNVAICLIPAFMIPLLWPVYSMYDGNFEHWIKSVLWQSQRTNDVIEIFGYFVLVDPIIFVFGFASIIFAAIKKNWFIVLWAFPFLIFFSLFGYKQYFHLIALFPVFCIGIAIMFNDLPKIKHKITNYVVMAIIVFGFVSTTLVIIENVSEVQFQVMQYGLNTFDDETILASPVYAWIFEKYGKENVMQDYSEILFYPPNTDKIVLLSDRHFQTDLNRGPQLKEIYDNTETIKTFEGKINQYNRDLYPYTSMKLISESEFIEIKSTG